MREIIDIFEVVLKKDMKISLTKQEQSFYDSLDETIKDAVIELINTPSYIDEVEKTCRSIILKSKASQEEQRDIKEKCEERIKSLKSKNYSQSHPIQK